MSRYSHTIFAAIAGLIILSSCSSPESVSEKALKLVGIGTFAPNSVERSIGLIHSTESIFIFSKYEKIFDKALIYSHEAEDFRRTKIFREIDRDVYFYFSDAVFEKWELVKKDQYKIDLYERRIPSKNDEHDAEVRQILDEYDAVHKEDFIKEGDISTWIEAHDVPLYELRYKLDNCFFANITVLKLPDVGCRVCSFRIDR